MAPDARLRDTPAALQPWIDAARGDLRGAEHRARAVLDGGVASEASIAGAHLALGVVAWARDRMEEAQAALRLAVAHAEAGGHAGLAALVALAQALVTSSAGDHLTAISTVVDVDRRLFDEGRAWPPRGIVDGVDAHVHLAAGDVDRAEVLTRRLPEGTDRSLLEARVALARGRFDVARAGLEALLDDDDLDRRQRIEALLLASRAEESSGDHVAARTRRRAAAALASPERHLRIYHDLGVEAPHEAGRRPAGVVSPLWLSAKERQVLRLLHERLDNREIGEAMYISVNTVKTHLQSIYRKLGVESRRQAVERARDLGLL